MRSREVDPITINRTANRIVRIGVAVVTGLALNFGIDQGSKTADAATSTPTKTSTLTSTRTPTPTVVPTATPTPDVLATQIAQVQKNIEELRRRQEMERKLANLNATEEALKNPPTETPRPIPSNTPPASATPGPKINEVVEAIETVVAGRMNEKATATARAVLSVVPIPAAPDPTATSAAALERVSKEQENRGFPVIPVAGAGALVGAGVTYWRSTRVRNTINGAAAGIINFVRTRLHI